MKIISTKILKKYHNPFQYKEVISPIYYNIKEKLYVEGFMIELEESLDELLDSLLEQDIYLIDSFEENHIQYIECASDSLQALQTLKKDG